jgi:hypothetical protein
MTANITQRHGPQQGITQRMKNNVAVRMGEHNAMPRHGHATQHDRMIRFLFSKAMGIKARADSHSHLEIVI